ncbi:MAG: leucine-rich repeat domain-containing protein [Candidatus Heimdallarchaeota archaeon]|nr:leucine-rich repeat domain-containing protein [Candidatus Heimdallarchaeota archaeon]
MVFDELLDVSEENNVFDFLKPTRKNLDPLLGLNNRQTYFSIFIYSLQMIIAYLFLITFLSLENIHWEVLFQYFSFFIGIGAFIDQIVNPDENSKFGYYILLAVYYVIYKVVIFGGLIWIVFAIMGKTYEIHFLSESLPFLTIFLFWALGQKIGFYFQHHRLLRKAEDMGFDALNDIDKLKIFLYQVNRRSFLKMIIQAGKAKFHNTEFLDLSSPEETQNFSRLVYLDMSKFLKYLKLKILPQSKYVTFSQIKQIDFSKNKIEEFSTHIFDIFPNVEKIDLSDNKIKSISDKHKEIIMLLNRSVIINLDGNPVFTG